MEREIYFRIDEGTAWGVFSDLKTLKGACKRLERLYPEARDVEVQYDRPVGEG